MQCSWLTTMLSMPTSNRYDRPAWPSRHRPYHHGNLRAALLACAERTLREGGAGELSLRELARQVGVSHAAPRRHFADKQALLDALAEDGFERLGRELREAMDAAGDALRRPPGRASRAPTCASPPATRPCSS